MLRCEIMSMVGEFDNTVITTKPKQNTHVDEGVLLSLNHCPWKMTHIWYL